jgi:O-antigen/teichoic acid export membrane protein
VSGLRRNVIANFVAKGWAAGLGLVFPPIYARLLGIESYGLVGLFASISAMLGVLDLGLSTTLQREIAVQSDDGSPEAARRRRDLVRTFEVVFWCTGAMAGLGLVAAAPLIVHRWIHVQALAPDAAIASIRAMGAVFALQWSGVIYSGALLALQRQVSANTIALIGNTIRSVGSALVVWLVWRSPTAFFLSQGVAMGLQTLVTAVWLSRSLGPAPGRAAFQLSLLRRTWRFSAGTWGISLLGIALSQLDKVVVSSLLSLEALGYYTLAGTAASALYFLISPVFTAVFPRLCQLAGSERRVEMSRIYHLSAQVLAIAVGSAALVLCVFSKETLFAWTGNLDTVRNASGVLVMLAIGTALNGLMHLPYALQLAHGWTRLFFVTNCVGVLLMIPATYLLGLRLGPVGIASAWTILNAGYVVIVVPLMHRRLLVGESSRWYLQDVLVPIAGAAVAAFALRWGLRDSHLDARLACGIALAGAAVATLFASALATRDVRNLVVHGLRSVRTRA